LIDEFPINHLDLPLEGRPQELAHIPSQCQPSEPAALAAAVRSQRDQLAQLV
jgi:hypothetical protein